ncbi:helicase associated domain-containing protein [Mycobacterium sp. URHB0021]
MGLRHKQFCRVKLRVRPQVYATDSGFRLGSWVATQRQSYAKGQLSIGAVVGEFQGHGMTLISTADE